MDKAIAVTSRSEEILEKLNRSRDEITPMLSTLGEFYRDRKNYQGALKAYTKLAKLWEPESFSNPNYQLAARNVAVTYAYLKDLPASQEWYGKLFAALKKNPDQQAKVAESYADALRANGWDKQARKVMDQVNRNQTQR
jgi:tetratricopeptide (TPR) repeat protein